MNILISELENILRSEVTNSSLWLLMEFLLTLEQLIKMNYLLQ